MKFVDLHIHLLYGSDDGAKDEKKMREILDAAYADGTRIICATPHFHPGFFGDNRERSAAAFDRLKEYAKKYDDLTLCLGNELRFSPGCVGWLEKGQCRTLNQSHYVLVDFLENEKADIIMEAMFKILNTGYHPVLAHVERYEKFHHDLREVKALKEMGVLLQIDAWSPFGGWNFGSKMRSRRLLKEGYADLVASDAHDIDKRPPQMSTCYRYVIEKCGKEYAQQLFWGNPIKILQDADGEEGY